LQRAIGYTLSGHLGEGTCFLLTGSGQAAQQLFLSTIRALFGDYSSYIPILRPKYLTPALSAARIVTIPAHAFLSSYDSTTLATLINAEPLPIPPSSSSSVIYQSPAKLWFSAPDLVPLPVDLSYLRTRFTLLPITLSLPNHEACQLTQQLLEVLPAILTWAVQGYMLWSIEGLRPPEPVTTASATYQDEQDCLSTFLEHCCTTGDDSRTVRANELYQAYDRYWSRARGTPRISEYSFARLILLRGFRRSRQASGRLYHGLALTVPLNQLWAHLHQPQSSV
jgi:putative DNA primase/helicase